MHPILADWGRLGAYLAAWGLVGALIAVQLAFAGPFAWVEAVALAVPLALLFGFSGSAPSGSARPPRSPRAARPLARHPARGGAVSAALWLAAARGWAALLERLDVFPGLVAKQLQVAPLLFGLGFALFLLTAALNYLLMAMGPRRPPSAARCSSRSPRARPSCARCGPRSTRTSCSTASTRSTRCRGAAGGGAPAVRAARRLPAARA